MMWARACVRARVGVCAQETQQQAHLHLWFVSSNNVRSLLQHGSSLHKCANAKYDDLDDYVQVVEISTDDIIQQTCPQGGNWYNKVTVGTNICYRHGCWYPKLLHQSTSPHQPQLAYPFASLNQLTPSLMIKEKRGKGRRDKRVWARRITIINPSPPSKINTANKANKSCQHSNSKHESKGSKNTNQKQ